MDDEKLELRPEVIFKIYGSIQAQAKQVAPVDVRQELRISQDGRIKTKFYVTVSDRMVPHLLTAVQKQAETEGGTLKSYLYKLEEQLIAQMCAGKGDGMNIRFG